MEVPVKIYEYELALQDEQDVAMPVGARVLSVQAQDGRVVLWAKVDETTHYELRRFRLYGTGVLLPETPGKYVGTVQLGAYVFHVFEVTPAIAV